MERTFPEGHSVVAGGHHFAVQVTLTTKSYLAQNIDDVKAETWSSSVPALEYASPPRQGCLSLCLLPVNEACCLGAAGLRL